MRIKAVFGHDYVEELSWSGNSIFDFPKHVEYKNRFWDTICYEKDRSGNFTYIVTFSEVTAEVARNRGSYLYQWFESLRGYYDLKCECGAVYTDFPQQHMFYCPKYVDIMKAGPKE